MDETIRLIDALVSLGLKTGAVAYNKLINGFCTNGRMQEGSILSRVMPSEGVKHGVISYVIILQGDFRMRKAVSAKGLYLRMIISGICLVLLRTE
jgi:pentatricopeptide repeat protein